MKLLFDENLSSRLVGALATECTCCRHIRSKLRPDGSYYYGALTHAIRKNEEHWGIEPTFCTHDLRRTMATMMSSIGVPRLHLKRVLNHKVGDITDVYDRYDYFEEKQTALYRWANHLEAILDNKLPKVVPIKRAAAAA